MNNTGVIQVRISNALRKASEKRADELGLSSVQEAIRLFLHGFTTNKLSLGVISEEFPAEEVKLSTKARKRYAQIESDLNRSKNRVVFENPEDALTWLTRSLK